jgi:beta-lactam-binding protein with PASTA domain
VANAIPELAGSTLEEATAIIEEAGATYFVVGVTEGDIPTGQVIGQSIEPGTIIGPGDVVTLTVAE